MIVTSNKHVLVPNTILSESSCIVSENIPSWRNSKSQERTIHPYQPIKPFRPSI